jgi:hypothetical protein
MMDAKVDIVTVARSNVASSVGNKTLSLTLLTDPSRFILYVVGHTNMTLIYSAKVGNPEK